MIELTQAEALQALAAAFVQMASRSPRKTPNVIVEAALFDADGRDVCRVNLGRPRLRSRAKDRRPAPARGDSLNAEKAPVG